MIFFVTRESQKRALYEALAETDMPYKVQISKGGLRTLEQNAYLWGVVYETILDSGLKESGWTNEDLHEYFLGEFHGWETIEGFGRKRMKPVQRSSGKSVSEFMEYLDFIIQKAAEMGIVVPDAEAKNGI